MVIDKLEQSRVKFTFDVTPEEFEKALDKAFLVKNAKVTIKGFRAGKAPRSVYEKMYGVESLYDEALDVIFNEKVQEVAKEEKLAKKFIGRFEPSIESQIERGKEFKVALTIDVFPEFELPQYKGVEVKKQNLEVTDAEVDAEIKSLVSKDVKKEAKEDGVIEANNFATFDFVGTVDGVEFPGGKAEGYELQIGSGQFIPGFEDQMIGMKKDEVKDITVTFPENYGEASLAGKEAVFKVTVHEVNVEVLPELTDEYVKSLNVEGVNTLDELKASKKKELAEKKAISEKDRQFNEIVNTILESANVDMPKTMIDERVEEIRGQYYNRAKMYNIPFDTFLSLMNVTKEAFEEETYKQGKNQALFSLLAGKIIEVENLTPTEETVKAKAEEDAQKSGSTAEEVLKANAMRYYNELAYQALVELLLSNAKNVD